MTTLIDRIMNKIEIDHTGKWADDMIAIKRILEAELTAVNGVDEIIWKRTEQHKLDLPEQDMCSKQNLIQLFIDDLKDLKQTPVDSEELTAKQFEQDCEDEIRYIKEERLKNSTSDISSIGQFSTKDLWDELGKRLLSQYLGL